MRRNITGRGWRAIGECAGRADGGAGTKTAISSAVNPRASWSGLESVIHGSDLAVRGRACDAVRHARRPVLPALPPRRAGDRAAVLRPRRPSRPLRRLCAFLRAAASSPGWLHRSSLVDYKLFAFTAFFFASGIGSYFVTSEGAQFAMQWTLSTIAGPTPVADHVNPLVAVPMAVAYVLLYDLGYWLAHFMMHRSPILWEFHKVHHSAEVLTPFTEYRQHPVELVLFPVFIGIGTGCVYAVAEHVFGMQAQGLSLFSINALMLAFMLTFLHLRHSQLWIPARGWLGRIVQSPAHHQIHHSTDPKHFDKNLGLCL